MSQAQAPDADWVCQRWIDALDELIRVGRASEALEQIASPSVTVTDRPRLLLCRCNALTELGRHAEAEASARAAVAEAPHDVSGIVALAECQLELGQRVRAEQTVRSALAIEPNHHGALRTLARSQLARDQLGAALESYRAALAVWPDCGSCGANVAFVLSELGRTDEAEEAARRVLAIHPEHVYSLLLLGHLCAKQGRADEAAELRALAIALDPSDEDAQDAIDEQRRGARRARARRFLDGAAAALGASAVVLIWHDVDGAVADLVVIVAGWTVAIWVLLAVCDR